MNIELSTVVNHEARNGVYTDPQAIQEWLSEVRRTVAAVTARMEQINKGNEIKILLKWGEGQKEMTVVARSRG